MLCDFVFKCSSIYFFTLFSFLYDDAIALWKEVTMKDQIDFVKLMVA
jgi:hypothetical protein